ncbi:MAG: hypothetical protein IJU66_07255 [Oscillospiraceae bacterium]|nr:hypothetical protein [Oscillospiraceae bacterium]
MNKERTDLTFYEALQGLPVSGTDRQLVYRGAMYAQSIGDTRRSIAYYRLGDREGGIYE